MIKIISVLSGLCILLNANINVSVSVIPQAFFVKQIAGDLVNVNIMVDKGKGPETYEPSIKQLKSLSKSDVYFFIGIPFENAWLERFKGVNPNMKIVQPLQKGILEEYLAKYEDNDNHHDHEKHYSDEKHHHHSPHIWLSFVLSKAHAKQIAQTLIEIDPKNTQIYNKNLEKFLSEIDEAYEDSKKMFENNKKSFLVFHPAWEYLANELNIKEYSIEKEGKEAKINHTKKILNIIKQNNIKVIFVQPQFSQKSANAIAKEANLKVKIADPLSYDWLNNLKNFLKEIAKN